MNCVSDGNFPLNAYEPLNACRSVRWWHALALAGIATMIVMRLLLLTVPLERDEGGYAYIGDRWLQGEIPYLHVVDTKPPGVFAVYALILQFGRDVQTIHMAGLLLAVLAALLFWRLTYRAYGARVAGIATALAALMTVSPKYLGFTLNSEMLMMPFILGAFLCLPFGTPSCRWRSFVLCVARPRSANQAGGVDRRLDRGRSYFAEPGERPAATVTPCPGRHRLRHCVCDVCRLVCPVRCRTGNDLLVLHL